MAIYSNTGRRLVLLSGILLQLSNIISGIYSIPFLETFPWLPLIAATILFRKKNATIYFQNQNYFIFIFIFILYLLIGMIYTNAITYAVWKIVIFSFYWLFIGWCLFNLGREIEVVGLFYFGIIIGTIISFVFIIYNSREILTIIDSSARFFRFKLGEKNEIILSQTLGKAVLLIIGFLLFNNRRKYSHIFFCSLFIFFIVGYMFFTGSKGPFVALFCGILFYISLLKFKRKILFIIFFCIFFVTFYNVLLKKISEEFIAQRYIISGSFDGRLFLWKNALSYFFSSDEFTYLFGTGTGECGFFYTGTDTRMYPHNIFIEILFENGLVGIIIFITILIYPVFIFYQKINLFDNLKHAKIIFISTAIYFYSIINGQMTGDLGTNYSIGIFGWLIFASIVHGNYKKNNFYTSGSKGTYGVCSLQKYHRQE